MRGKERRREKKGGKGEGERQERGSKKEKEGGKENGRTGREQREKERVTKQGVRL